MAQSTTAHKFASSLANAQLQLPLFIPSTALLTRRKTILWEIGVVMLLLRCCIVVPFMLLVGCASSPNYGPAPVSDRNATPPYVGPGQAQPSSAVVTPQPDSVPSVAPTSPTPSPVADVNPAAQSLAKQARNMYSLKDYQGAIATAERGLRIDRRAADLYLVLAQSYDALGQTQKAASFVQQGLRYAPAGSATSTSLQRLQHGLGR